MMPSGFLDWSLWSVRTAPVANNTLIAVSILISSECLVYSTQAGYHNNYKIIIAVWTLLYTGSSADSTDYIR